MIVRGAGLESICQGKVVVVIGAAPYRFGFPTTLFPRLPGGTHARQYRGVGPVEIAQVSQCLWLDSLTCASAAATANATRTNSSQVVIALVFPLCPIITPEEILAQSGMIHWRGRVRQPGLKDLRGAYAAQAPRRSHPFLLQKSNTLHARPMACVSQTAYRARRYSPRAIISEASHTINLRYDAGIWLGLGKIRRMSSLLSSSCRSALKVSIWAQAVCMSSTAYLLVTLSPA